MTPGHIQPHDDVLRRPTSPETSLDHPNPPLSQKNSPASQKRKYDCNFPRCKSSFKRISELNRHTKKHGKDKQIHTCPAVGCSRSGDRAFSRGDKLREHVLAGHNADALFECDVRDCTCGMTMPKDMMAIHHLTRQSDSSLHILVNYRCCPFERCNKRYNLYGRNGLISTGGAAQSDFGHLQAHLFNDHTLESRSRLADVIGEHGYHHLTMKILCPVCAGRHLFQRYVDFYRHFLEEHCDIQSTTDFSKVLWMYQGHMSYRSGVISIFKLFRECRHIPDQVRQHRLTIVRLWPHFIAHPVWDDIRPVYHGWERGF